MKILNKSAILSVLMLGSFSTLAANANINDLKNMSETDKKQFVQALGPEMINYLVQNPEFLIEASKNLQEKEQQQALVALKDNVKTNIDELISNEKTPFVGNKDSDLVFVSFTDYNCVYCKKSNPELEKLMEKNKDVKFIFKEYPIFQGKLEGSKFGALVGQKVFAEKGGDAYLKYHNILMSNENTNGVENVISAANQVGLVVDKDFKNIGENEVSEINKNIQLAGHELNITGTPAFIIINKKDLNKTEFVSGADDADNIQILIDRVK